MGGGQARQKERKKEGKHHHYVYNPQHQQPPALHECRSTLWIIWSSSFHSTRKSSPFRYPQVTFTFFSLRPPTHIHIGWNCEWMVIQDDRSSPWNCVCVFKVFNKREMNFPCVEMKKREFHLDIPALSLSRYIRAHHLSLGTILICGISIFSTGLALILSHFIMRTPLGTWMVIKWMAILDERRCWF